MRSRDANFQRKKWCRVYSVCDSDTSIYATVLIGLDQSVRQLLNIGDFDDGAGLLHLKQK